MAYDRDKILDQLIKNIEADEDITTFKDASATVKPSRQILYEWEFDKLDILKSKLDENAIKVKKSLRSQWKKEGASPTLQIALYKLLADPYELRSLAMEHTEHSFDKGFKKLEIEFV
jgi:hypothetical protein